MGKAIFLYVLHSCCWLMPLNTYSIAKTVTPPVTSIKQTAEVPSPYISNYTYLADLSQDENMRWKESAANRSRITYEAEKQELLLVKHQLINWLWLLLGIILLLVALLASVYYRHGRRWTVKKKRLVQLEEDTRYQEQRIYQLSAMLEGQERERSQLARDLHDSLGGLLSGIKLQLSGIASFLQDGPQLALVKQTMCRMDNAMDELRSIARNMMPDVLIQYGLQEAIMDYCRALTTTEVNITCQVYNYTESLNITRQTVLYRIVQELVSNALKYAGASNILVQLQQSGPRLYLTVEDNGKGFEPLHSSQAAGTGLASIRARVAYLNGNIEFQSQPGAGTSISIECDIA
ncbi:sensor histidine kinase [Chitinophaga pendula]|uniref:sensor histidine kinase n=1 Tax=Chitinophaga TaxID=79328 RepID=UPI0018DFBC11|nr:MULTISPECIES: sensor histidine kinase [Chitinophaga]UCJ08548.1 sensor histidine kinase [Chitinophaga pendula]